MKNISHTLQETSWWLLLLVGIVAIIISIVALIIPHQLTVLIVRLLGGYWLLTGVLSLIHMQRHKAVTRTGSVMVGLGIIAGLVMVFFDISRLVILPLLLFIIFACVGIIYGITQIIQGARGEGAGVIAMGILSILFGVVLLLLLLPLGGFLSLSIAFLLAVLPLVVSFCSVVIGVFLVTHALRRHRHLQEPSQSMPTMQEQ